eukprot:TRINITY_DN3269_c0_g1_i1.p1 TRINITY_DN3269_c0_g1~~TRINITY_DN3269_c0_g1_i1.p1  ORF type:complete len:692 (+),score=152.77 TRINITY_DN3269_c0_g1_i1:57-2132(+)
MEVQVGHSSAANCLALQSCSDVLDRLSSCVLSACIRCGADEQRLPNKVSIAPPPKPDDGDFCFGAYELVKAFKGQRPHDIADMLAKEIASEALEAVKATGAYVNFHLACASLAGAAIKDILFGELAAATISEVQQPHHWLLEFSSPNTNKPQHLGHVRNNLLGDSCSRLLSMQGHKVTKVNLVNDRGIHICKSMLAYKKYGKGEVPGTPDCSLKGDHLVGHYYVEYEKHFQAEWKAWLASEEGAASFKQWQIEAKGLEVSNKIQEVQEKVNKESDPKAKEKLLKGMPDLFETFKKSFKDYYAGHVSPLGLECNKMLQDWEAAAESDTPESYDIYQLWKTMNSWVLSGFFATYSRMGITFDHVDYESLTYQLGKSICEQALKDDIMHKTANGAVAINYSQLPSLKMQGEKILLRPNGTSVYMTQDLGTAFLRWDKFGAEHMGYVVASEQREHFQTLFEVLALLRPEMKGKLSHLSYGMVNLTTGRMKSREGTVVDADNLMDEMAALAAESTRAKCPELSEEEVAERSEKIGLAALKFYILSAPSAAAMVYDPETSIKFEGNTGPYVLYSYVRTRSILRKCMTSPKEVLATAGDLSCLAALGTAEERAVVRCLFTFNSSMHAAATALDPAKVCKALLILSQAFSKFFFAKENNPIKECSDPVAKQARLLLVEAVGTALRQGLALLGINTLESM